MKLEIQLCTTIAIAGIGITLAQFCLSPGRQNQEQGIKQGLHLFGREYDRLSLLAQSGGSSIDNLLPKQTVLVVWHMIVCMVVGLMPGRE